MMRDLILTLTILALVSIFAHQPAPVKATQVDYCLVASKGTFYPCSGLKYRLNV